MPGKSTSALTPEQHAAQDARYAEGREYDYVIVGAGNSSLTLASLLAKKGERVAIVEAHDIPGGYAQNFSRGEYVFNAQIHYIWGCAPGGKIFEFLKHVGLEKDIEFNLYDADAYDVMRMPDGKKINVPYGFDQLVKNVAEAYPDQQVPMEKFVSIIRKIRTEMKHVPSGKSPW